MQSKLGENIAREWSEEPHAPELWDALQLVKSDPAAGIEALEHLAENGSSLAMMYLGDIYLKGKHSVPKSGDLGEAWLKRSARRGSIEGAYGLAWHLRSSDRPSAALAEYERLADLKYPPALFALGREYYKGELVERDLDKALFYFRLAEQQGHLYAAHQISHILMRENMSPFSWLHGVAKWIAMIIPFVRTNVNYPTSDRLRK